MTPTQQRRLLRLLRQEPPASPREIAEAFGGDRELETVYRRLAATWRDLEPPPAPEVPAGFAAAVVAAARRQTQTRVVWSQAPAWARAGAMAALWVGVILGVFFGPLTPPPPAEPDVTAGTFLAAPASLAEIYWLGLDADPDLFEPEETRR